MQNDINLGQLIAKRRKQLMLTQEELASRIGVSKSAVAKWELNLGLPDRDNLKKLSEVLNVSVDDLYRIIDLPNIRKEDLKVNITPDVIKTLESYGYVITRPGENKEQ